MIESNGELTRNLPTPQGWHYAWIGIWQRFDTLWYLRIAEHGYDKPAGVVFYPLYPMAVRGLGRVVPISALSVALLISTAAAFFFFWGLLRLAGELSAAGRLRTLVLFNAWPTSFVLFAGYADSVTLALAVWAVIFGRRRRWEAATVCGILAGAARPPGVLVVIPLMVMAWRSRQVRSLVVALTPLGVVGYWIWLGWSGHPSVVEAYRDYHGVTMAPPWAGFMGIMRAMVTQHDALIAIKLGLVVLLAAMSFWGKRPGQTRTFVGTEDKALTLAVVLQMLMYTGRPLLGATRYVLMAYPGFLGWGAYAEGWNGRRFTFCVVALGFLNLVWFWAFLNWSLVM